MDEEKQAHDEPQSPTREAGAGAEQSRTPRTAPEGGLVSAQGESHDTPTPARPQRRRRTVQERPQKDGRPPTRLEQIRKKLRAAEATRNKLRRQERGELSAERERQRKATNRQWIVAGRAFLDHRPGGAAHPVTRRTLDGWLTDPHERALFGLPPKRVESGTDSEVID